MTGERGGKRGGFEVGRSLGSDGYGARFLATRGDDGGRVVLLVLDSEMADATARIRGLEEEIRAYGTVVHAHLGRVLALARDDGDVLYVQEHLEGPSLADYAEGGPLGIDAAEELTLQIVGALAALHARGLSHGDVRPGTIRMTERGARLEGFGLARVAAGVKQVPERLPWVDDVTASPSFASDVRGVALSLRRALLGDDGERAGTVAQLRSELPKWLSSLVDDALSGDFARVPADAAAMYEACQPRVSAYSVLDSEALMSVEIEDDESSLDDFDGDGFSDELEAILDADLEAIADGTPSEVEGAPGGPAEETQQEDALELAPVQSDVEDDDAPGQLDTLLDEDLVVLEPEVEVDLEVDLDLDLAPAPEPEPGLWQWFRLE